MRDRWITAPQAQPVHLSKKKNNLFQGGKESNLREGLLPGVEKEIGGRSSQNVGEKGERDLVGEEEKSEIQDFREIPVPHWINSSGQSLKKRGCCC